MTTDKDTLWWNPPIYEMETDSVAILVTDGLQNDTLRVHFVVYTRPMVDAIVSSLFPARLSLRAHQISRGLQVEVEIPLNSTEITTLRCCDPRGRTVAQRQLRGPGRFRVVIADASLPRGVYLVTVASGGAELTAVAGIR